MSHTFRVLHATTDAAAWQEYVDRLPADQRDVHLLPSYLRCWHSGMPFAAVYEWEGIFVLQPFLLRMVGDWCDMRSAYPFGGPVGHSSRLWMWFDEAFRAWREANRVVCEFCQLNPLLDQHRLLREAPFTVHDIKEAVAVDLRPNDLMATFSRNRQRAILWARAQKVEINAPGSGSLFHELYHRSMARLGAAKRWSLPIGFAAALVPEHMTIFTAGDVVALMVLHGYGRAYAAYLGRADDAPPGLADLVYYKAMVHCREIGCHTFFLGGGTSADPLDTLLAYKRGFGKRTVPVMEYRRIFDQFAYDLLCQQTGRSDLDANSNFFPAYRRGEAA